MFDSLKAMGAISQLLKNKDAITQAMSRVKARLKDLRCVGSAGAGAVRVTCSGELTIVEVHLEPALLASISASSDPAMRPLAQQLVLDAANDALAKARAAAAAEVQREADALGLGDLLNQSGGNLSRLLGM